MSEPRLVDALRTGCRPGDGNGGPLLSRLDRSIDAARLEQALAHNDLVDRVIVLGQVDSTNDEVRRRAADGCGSGLVVVADEQSVGRGRRGRAWHSAPGLGLYVSVLLHPGGIPAGEVTRWTLGASVAACLACRETSACPVTIEWPNDLVLGRRKVAGILTELRSAGGAARELVIGAGFNVHHRDDDWPAGLSRIAISLRQAAPCGIVLSRGALAVAYLDRLREVVARLREGRWERVAARWTELAPLSRGASVRVAGGARGVTDGLDPSGALRVCAADGRVVLVHMADTVTVEEG